MSQNGTLASYDGSYETTHFLLVALRNKPVPYKGSILGVILRQAVTCKPPTQPVVHDRFHRMGERKQRKGKQKLDRRGSPLRLRLAGCLQSVPDRSALIPPSAARLAFSQTDCHDGSSASAFLSGAIPSIVLPNILGRPVCCVCMTGSQVCQ